MSGKILTSFSIYTAAKDRTLLNQVVIQTDGIRAISFSKYLSLMIRLTLMINDLMNR